MPENLDLDDEYDKHVREKHRNWDTPIEILFPAIAAISNLAPISRIRIVKGENSEVYRIQTEEGRGLIARIFHGENPQYERERWAIDQARLAGVPVPEVLGIRRIDTIEGPITLCLENELAGIEFEEIESIQNPGSSALFKKLMREAGAILAKIHSVKTTGFGPLDKTGKGRFQTLADVWLIMEKWRNKTAEVAAASNADPKLMAKARDLLKEAAAEQYNLAPFLVHDDYAPKHIMVAHGQIAGVIDFESCEGGDPVRDFARWEYHKKDFPIEYLLEGYTARLPSDFNVRLKLWKVHMGLTTLDYYLGEGNRAAIYYCILKLEEDLSFFR